MTYKITSGFVQEIEYLFDKLNLFVYNKDFSNVYYLWNQYKYNLTKKYIIILMILKMNYGEFC